MGNEWVRLTPEGEDDSDLLLCEVAVSYIVLQPGFDDDGTLRLAGDCLPIQITTDELNVLSRHAPEVKAREQQVEALVTAAKEAREELETIHQNADDQWQGDDGEGDRVIGELVDTRDVLIALTKAIALFTEATDA